ncbi:MAG: tRNA (adenosine(37)-N6)-threonylcarbamoyltransferase complex ATPase subunit type 1 TsaE [Planctomycetota bacterium]|nr:MAG: tRNA (adenosine(37)-N6)-threonylcarbamoyltransferase complex ATPase subunit type 1 TsaE [Planctomycetota bacterium]
MSSSPEAQNATTISLKITSLDSLCLVAGRLASALPEHAFVSLSGDLGAGKTTFVKAVAEAIGINACEVISPTFGLIHIHKVNDPARLASPHSIRLVHADLYRLTGPGDLHEIGWEEAIAAPCWVFLEWGSRVAAALPEARLDIAIEIDSLTARTFTFTSRQLHCRAVLDRLLESPDQLLRSP